jgi:hypothetical protein
MAKNRYIGKGALVKVNSNGDGNTYITVGLCTNVTPPPQEKATIDCTAMEDAVAIGEQGIEQLSEFSFEALHDPADTTDDAIDTLYGSGASVNWQLLTIAGTHTHTKTFAGRVFGIVPTALDKNGVQKRTVKVIRNGAIVDTQT